ncbi:ABC transporter substrate-binding protein [Candidatus Pelagibacter sp.]|uniref:ABC transporter substrate-binding protein n=1 Tax=Candidatus Pelagibacter sp. TaxID=2024849 RepID=UPI003F8767BD
MKNIIRLFCVISFFISSIVYADIKFWTTEVQPARMAKQEEMAKAFEAKTGIKVEVIPVEEKDLGTRATAAAAAGDLPDVIYHTLQYVLPWAEAGILDVDANNDVVKDLGKNTFAPGALNMAKKGSKIAAVPVDGWTQMVVYRKDLFENADLAPPTSYANIVAAVEKLSKQNGMFGFVAATKTDENFMSQVLEHVLLANGVNIVKKGGIKKQGKKLKEALEFYKVIAKASPPGELYWKQSRALYFAGKTPMIIWSPFIMDELAGLRDSAPPTINSDPTSPELASKTGFITNFSGPSNKKGAAWADVRYFGITADADTDEAKQFIMYSMDEGYASTLSIAPEGKFPVRRGNSSDPEAFTKAWSKLPVGVDRKAPLSDLYDPDVINNIVAGLDTANRWGVKEGELSRASKVINSQFINRITRLYIDDQIDVDEAVKMINDSLAKFK